MNESSTRSRANESRKIVGCDGLGHLREPLRFMLAPAVTLHHRCCHTRRYIALRRITWYVVVSKSSRSLGLYQHAGVCAENYCMLVTISLRMLASATRYCSSRTPRPNPSLIWALKSGTVLPRSPSAPSLRLCFPKHQWICLLHEYKGIQYSRHEAGVLMHTLHIHEDRDGGIKLNIWGSCCVLFPCFRLLSQIATGPMAIVAEHSHARNNAADHDMPRCSMPAHTSSDVNIVTADTAIVRRGAQSRWRFACSMMRQPTCVRPVAAATRMQMMAQAVLHVDMRAGMKTALRRTVSNAARRVHPCCATR